MPVMDVSPPLTLRQILREATQAEHTRLDRSVTTLDFARAGDYRRFLRLQLAARRPVEAWLATQTLPFGAPPPLASLIADDLRDLGAADSDDHASFAPPDGADPIGACWAIAGSSLGNKAMHRALLRAAPDSPSRFLADTSTTEYWQHLKPVLETGIAASEAAGAVACARAVFATFLATAETLLRRETT